MRRPRLGPILFRHVLGDLWRPTLLALLGFALVVLLRDLVAYTDWIVNRGLGGREVLQIAFWRLLPALGETLPFSVLIGSLVGLGRLGADREIQAMEAAGLSMRQLALPVVAFAAVASLAGIGVAESGAPWAARRLERAFLGMLARHPTASLRSGQVSRFGDWQLEAREVSAGGERMQGVLLWAPGLGETIFARRGSLAPDPAGGLRVVLEQGVLVSSTADGPARVDFEQMRQHVEPTSAAAPPVDWLAALDRPALEQAARTTPDPGARRAAWAEWHRRLALPLAALLFGLLVVPLALGEGGRSRAGGVGLGLGAGGSFYALMLLANAGVHSESVPVAAAIWFPDAVLVLATAALALRLARRSQPPRWGTAGLGAARRRARRRRTRRHVLDRYVAARFLRTALLCLLALLVAYWIVDVLDNLQWFTKYRSSVDEVTRFYAARLPLLASRVVPLALVIASALTLSLLAARGELLGMRACGVSVLRTAAPLLWLCALAAVADHVLVDGVLPRTNALATRIKRTEIKGRSLARSAAWYRVGHRLYQARWLDPLRGVAQDVTVYELSDEGLPLSRTDAPEARYVGDGVWRLIDPVAIDLRDGVRPRRAPSFARLGVEGPAQLDTSSFSIAQLLQEIREVEAGGFDATPHRVDLYQKLAAPVACFLLPALALLFAASGPPFPSPMAMVVGSVALAALHAALTAAGASLGYRGILPPLVAGWTPVALLAGATLWMGVRVRGFVRGIG